MFNFETILQNFTKKKALKLYSTISMPNANPEKKQNKKIC